MYVCLCLGVSDRDLRRAVEAGACSAAEVMACTGAGTRCGACRPTVATLVAAHADAPPLRAAHERGHSHEFDPAHGHPSQRLARTG